MLLGCTKKAPSTARISKDPSDPTTWILGLHSKNVSWIVLQSILRSLGNRSTNFLQFPQPHMQFSRNRSQVFGNDITVLLRKPLRLSLMVFPYKKQSNKKANKKQLQKATAKKANLKSKQKQKQKHKSKQQKKSKLKATSEHKAKQQSEKRHRT